MCVWDASCGSGSLGRGRNFRHLLLSSLHESEVQSAASLHRIAPLTAAFDFLSTMDVPAGFEETLRDQSLPLLFLNNPPFKTANEQVE